MIKDVIGWTLVAVAAGLGVYACVLIDRISGAVAHIIVNIFL